MPKKRGRSTEWRTFATPFMRKYGRRGLTMAAAQWRGGRGRANENPWYGQAKRHATAARKGWASRKRARNNPVARTNPDYFRYGMPSSVSYNPYYRYGLPASVAANPYVKPYSYYRAGVGTVKVKGHKRKVRKNQGYFRYGLPAGVVANPVFENDIFSTAAGGPAAPAATAAPRPTMAARPAGAVGMAQLQGMEFVKKFFSFEFLWNHFAPLGTGFIATKFLIGALTKRYEVKAEDSEEVQKKKRETLDKLETYRGPLLILTGLGVGLGVGWGTKSTDWAVRVATGGIFAGALAWVEKMDWYKTWMGTAGLEGLKGLGAAMSTTARQKIAKMVEEEVAKEASAMRLSGIGRAGMGAFATESELRQPETFSGIGAFATEDELVQPESGPGAPMSGVNGLGGVSLDEYLAGPSMGL